MKKRRQPWIPVPVRWFTSADILDLPKNARLVMLQGWYHTTDGTLPSELRQLRIAVGLPISNARLHAVVQSLLECKVLRETDAGLEFTDWRSIYNRGGNKWRTNGNKKSGQNLKQSRGSAAYSHAHHQYHQDDIEQQSSVSGLPYLKTAKPEHAAEEKMDPRAASIVAKVGG